MTQIHVAPGAHGWAVQHEGAAPLSTHATFEDGERLAKHSASAYRSAQIVLRGRDGRIPPAQPKEPEPPGAGH